jgi:hypothetical protein
MPEAKTQTELNPLLMHCLKQHGNFIILICYLSQTNIVNISSATKWPGLKQEINTSVALGKVWWLRSGDKPKFVLLFVFTYVVA